MDRLQAPDPAARDERLWRNRAFAHLFWAHTISLFGASLSSVAIGLLAHELVGASVSTVVGITLTIRIAVVVFLAPFAGSLSHRLGAKRTLIAADIFRAAVVTGFFFADAVWQIYLLALLLNIASAVFTPVYKAAIPNIVSAAQYPRALSFGSISYDMANIAGPALAGLLILWFGFRGNFLAHSAAFLLSALLIFPIRVGAGEAAPAAEPDRWHGIRAMLGRTELLRALFLALKVSIGGGFILVATVDHVKNNLQLPDSYYAWAMAAYGIGSVGGALAYGQTPSSGVREWLYRILPWGLLAGLLVAAFTHHFAWLMTGWLLAGAGQSVLGLRSNEALAAHSIPDERAHVYSAHFALSHAGWGVTYPLAGWTTTVFGFNRSALFFALLFVTATAGQWLFFRRRRLARTEGSITRPPHGTIR